MLVLAIALTFIAVEAVIFAIVLLIKIGDPERPGSWEWWSDVGAGMLAINGILSIIAVIVGFIWLLIWVWGEALA